jgi:hypothetical protein
MAMHVFSQGDLISIAQFDLDQHQNISSPQTECNSLLSLCPYIKQYRLLLDLRHPIFTHGQLYVDLRRVKDGSQVRCLVPNNGPPVAEISSKSWVTTNVVLRKMLTDSDSLNDSEPLAYVSFVTGMLSFFVMKKSCYFDATVRTYATSLQNQVKARR